MLKLKILKTKISKGQLAIFFIVFIALFVLTIALVIFNLNQSKIFTIKENTYQYFFGEKFSYPVNTNLEISGKKETILKLNNQDSYLDGTPIFYKNKNGIILPRTMEYINVKKSQTQSVSFFSEVFSEENNFVLHKNGAKVNINGGFLFDWGDIYIFLEPFSIKIGTKEINIEPFSYAEVIYNQSFSIYLKDKDIKHCSGCFTCWTKTPGKCIHKDDMEELLHKISQADVIVYATPLYYYTVKVDERGSCKKWIFRK